MIESALMFSASFSTEALPALRSAKIVISVRVGTSKTGFESDRASVPRKKGMVSASPARHRAITKRPLYWKMARAVCRQAQMRLLMKLMVRMSCC